MTTQLLIYKSAVPISRAAHHDSFVDVGSNYAFTAEVNSVPLMAVEFPLAAAEYAIVFGGPESDLTPAAILGLRTNENLFLSDTGGWQARYLPAFVRRYPFVFSHTDERFVLCIDEEFPGFNREGRGQRLFNEDGTPSAYVDGIMKFLQDYQAQFLTTQRFCAKVRDLGLLEPTTAQVTPDGGAPVSLGGFMAVSRERLKALPGETLAELAKTDELELIYIHLNSLRNFDRFRERLGQQPVAPALH
jgi:hypothetical protein